jgi:Flp pilus assembly protein TadG
MRVRNALAQRERRGATVVEFAILLPFLMFLFVIAIDFARVFYFGVVVENCARNGAYFASDYPNASYLYNDIYGYKDLDDAILRDASTIYNKNDATTKPTYTVTYSGTTGGTQYVTVTVQWNFRSVTRFPGVPSLVQITRTVTMEMAPAMPSF